MASDSSELDPSFLKSEVVCPWVMSAHLLEPQFPICKMVIINNNSNNNTCIMFPGCNHPMPGKSETVKATVTTEDTATTAEPSPSF